MSNPPSSLIYHLALRGDWDDAVSQGGLYRMSTLGKSLAEVGYIHCSFAGQVAMIANTVYRGRDDVVLLSIDTGHLPSPVRVESVEGGQQQFPHIYGPLPVVAVVRVDPVPLLADGRLGVVNLPRSD